MRSKLITMAVVSSFVAALLYGAIHLGRRSLTPMDIVDRYQALFGLHAAPELGPIEYPYKTSTPDDLYLDLVKVTLTDSLYDHPAETRKLRTGGGLWPSRAFTMIGLKRLDNIEICMEDVLARAVPGDFIEAGAWRGGATIFMRAVLKAHNVTDRTVWVADSFEGLPPPDAANFPADADIRLDKFKALAVSRGAVEQNFRRYGLLDDQVRFLEGWFKDTLPKAPIEKLGVLRIDADLYESTIEALEYLYPKLSPGGYVIVDDYLDIPCGKAVRTYRDRQKITEEMQTLDRSAVYWRKE
jgi:hypothetical protein